MFKLKLEKLKKPFDQGEAVEKELGKLGINEENLLKIKNNPTLRKAFLTMTMAIGVFTSVEINAQNKSENKKDTTELVGKKKNTESATQFIRKDFIRPEEVIKVEKLNEQNLLNLNGEYDEVIISRYNGYGGWTLAGMYSNASMLDANEYNSGIYKVSLRNNEGENIMYFEKDIPMSDEASLE